ncbi:MAG: PEP-CTERM system histidine kinase PrsK [Acidobacteriia bacterium]|nr:PEP-CTERM system histidine kinase PrsK [Terriglobia bacterium]
MTSLEFFQIISASIGLISAGLVLLFRRFGQASWLLCCFFFFSAAAHGTLTFAYDPNGTMAAPFFRLAFCCVFLAAPCGLLFTWSIARPHYRQALAEKRKLVAAILFPIPVLLIFLLLLPPAVDQRFLPPAFVALGPGGYLASIYLLVVCVMAFANMESILRSVEESVRWEVKFLILGLAASYAAITYIASKVLLYSFQYALLPQDAIHVFTLMFPISCALILVSWRRSSGRSVIRVSQSFIYSSITLLAVGTYLIASSLIARWVSQRGETGIRTEAVIFLLSVLLLAMVLLTTQFRHRARAWIHRNIFAGRYDYRHFWLEATERVKSVDDPRKTADSLARLIQNAVGSIDVSVWLRRRNPDRLVLLALLGTMADPESTEVSGIIDKLLERSEPLMETDLGKIADAEKLRQFMQRTNASILVPLVSSNRIVGLLTAGSDRTGRHYDREAREFLRVLANHAASEFHKYELLATLVEAKETEALKSFSTFLLHDLKNFASTLSLIAKNAARHQGNPDFQRDAFQSVFDTAEKMKRLCNNLRTFSTNLAANKKLDDLNQIVHAAVDSLNAGLSYRVHLELAELPPIFLDADEVLRVLQNLLLNAREALSPEGSITIKTARHDSSVELAVMDDGRGIAREFLEKELFLPFHTTKSDGLGIGLFQSKKIIEAHGGNIYVESEEGKGTVVRITFPAAT